MKSKIDYQAKYKKYKSLYHQLSGAVGVLENHEDKHSLIRQLTSTDNPKERLYLKMLINPVISIKVNTIKGDKYSLKIRLNTKVRDVKKNIAYLIDNTYDDIILYQKEAEPLRNNDIHLEWDDNTILSMFLRTSDFDQDILKQIYHTLTENKTNDLLENSNWLSDLPSNRWLGISTYNRFIYKISLVNLNLTGYLPESINQLTYLKTLNLANNHIRGNITEYVTIFLSLDNLSYINLSQNNLEGSLPITVGELVNLRYLNLSFNGITGIIPKTIGNLLNLQALNLSHNLISGILPNNINNLTKLVYLDLTFTHLDPPIPKRFFEIFKNKVRIDNYLVDDENNRRFLQNERLKSNRYYIPEDLLQESDLLDGPYDMDESSDEDY